MTNKTRRLVTALALFAAAAAATELRAQACHGLPVRGGAAYEYSRLGPGTSQGVSGGYAASRFAVDARFASRTINSALSGKETGGRVSFVLGSSRVNFCPALGVDYQNDSWNAAASTTLKSTALTLGGGVGVGLDQRILDDLSIIPFAVVGYEFTVIKYDLTAPNSALQTTGDTLRHVAIDYGLRVHYKFLFAGYSARRYSDASGSRPNIARYVLGITFPAKRSEE